MFKNVLHLQFLADTYDRFLIPTGLRSTDISCVDLKNSDGPGKPEPVPAALMEAFNEASLESKTSLSNVLN